MYRVVCAIERWPSQSWIALVSTPLLARAYGLQALQGINEVLRVRGQPILAVFVGRARNLIGRCMSLRGLLCRGCHGRGFAGHVKILF